jgi:hypothetical protein
MQCKGGNKKFSEFTLPQALMKLQIEQLTPWTINVAPCAPSDYFKERLRRLEQFDLTATERAKELLIDAFCEEALQAHERLKIWKGAEIRGEAVAGAVDYLIARNIAYLSRPLLCVVEAKKDDFEQGLAQCLVEMQACQWNNAQAGKPVDLYGIVTNGTTWQFYKLDLKGQVWETLPFSISALEQILAILDYVFTQCEQNI